MTVQEAADVKNLTMFEFFAECWTTFCGSKPDSQKIARDVRAYNVHGTIPHYVNVQVAVLPQVANFP